MPQAVLLCGVGPNIRGSAFSNDARGRNRESSSASVQTDVEAQAKGEMVTFLF